MLTLHRCRTRLRRALAAPGCLLVLVLAVWPLAAPAQVPEFDDIPYADQQWNYGRRFDESILRYCVDTRDPDWELAGQIADAIAGALLLEPQRYVVESEIVSEDITKLYEVMLKHCDVHMGFKLIPDGYADWLTVTRAYYETSYQFVTASPDLRALADLPPGHPIAATASTAAHLRLMAYVTSQPVQARWPVYPMGTNTLSLDSVLNGTAEVALVWAPSLWAAQRSDPKYAPLHPIAARPLAETRMGVGAVVLANESFLRTALDEAIAALAADGTIAGLLKDADFPAEVAP